MNRQKFKSDCTKLFHNDPTFSKKKKIIAETFISYLTGVAVKISSEKHPTNIDSRDFLQDYNFTLWLQAKASKSLKD